MADAGLQRRIKKVVHAAKHRVVVRYPRGWQDVVRGEIEASLASLTHAPASDDLPRVSESGTDVAIENLDFRALCELPYRLLTVRELYWELARGKAGGIKELVRTLEKAPFDLVFPPGSTVALRVTATASRLYHEGRIAELVGKELAKLGLVVTDKKTAEHLVELRLFENELVASVALGGGRPLHQRGVKEALAGKASVREDIAAAATLWALGTTRPSSTHVPFAGSGTLGFEAMLRVTKLPPFLFGREYGHEKFLCAPEASLRHTRKKLVERSDAMRPRIQLVEVDAEQCEVLRANCASVNAKLAAQGLAPAVFEVTEGDALASAWPQVDAMVFVPLNPPYGLRLEDKASAWQRYRDTAKRVKEMARARAVRGFVFVPEESWAKQFSEAIGRGSCEERSFVHGGRTVIAVKFRLG